MVEPISPKTILPRSLEMSRLEQTKKSKPIIYQNQIDQDMQEKDIKKQERVNETKEVEHQRIDKEEQDKEHQKRKKEEQGNKDNKKEKHKNRINNSKTGRYIDIRV